MNFEINLNTILEGVVIGFAIWGMKGISGINRHLALLNGRVGVIDVRVDMHEKTDDDRHMIENARIQALEMEIKKG